MFVKKKNVSCSIVVASLSLILGLAHSIRVPNKNSEGSLSLLSCKSSAPDFQKENNVFADITKEGMGKIETSLSVAFVINRGWEIKRENLDMTFLSPYTCSCFQHFFSFDQLKKVKLFFFGR
jgi:hypothetical protein